MCKITEQGYDLNNGKHVKVQNVHPDALPKAVREELEQAPASQLDILYLRTNMHKNAQNIENVKTTLGNIETSIANLTKTFEDNMSVVVCNGSSLQRPITELIAELWELHHDKRDVSIIRSFLTRHRRKIFAAFVFFLLLNIWLREPLHSAIDWIAANFLEIMKWIF